MSPILQWGIDLITAIQRIHGPALDTFFRAVSFLGEELAFLLILPIFLWCVDYGAGMRLGCLFLFSSYLNTDLKDLFRQPRPFDLEPGVKIGAAEGYGLPSGHAQSAVVVWGMAAAWARRAWVWAAAIVLILAIGFSRVYLGVHFPTDVLAGWAIGAILLLAALAIPPSVVKGFTPTSARLNRLRDIFEPQIVRTRETTRPSFKNTKIVTKIYKYYLVIFAVL